jgi:uncharacterized protein (DUF2267 family)
MPAQSTVQFESMVQRTNEWLHDVMLELHTNDRHMAYHALRAVLHALRDRLTVDEATDLGAQLPTLIRGIYYEGWKPAAVPVRERKKEQLLECVRQSYQQDAFVDVEDVVRAVFRVLAKRVSSGEIEDIRRSLPDGISALWSA